MTRAARPPPTPGTWLPDPSHYPEQMTPLSATTWFEAVGRGLHEAARDLGAPFGGFVARVERGWAYEGELEPDWAPRSLDGAALGLERRWNAELAPRAHQITEALHSMRPERGTPHEAGALFDRAWDLVLEQWRIHFLAVVPSQVAAELLHDRYVALFPDADPLEPYRLLHATPNESMQADALLWSLAQRARDLAVADVLVEYPPRPALERLRELRQGRTWLAELDAYLLRFGGRSRWHELSLPREAESPAMALDGIRLFLERGQPPITSRADEAAALERKLLSAAPDAGDLLSTARFAYGLKESHAYHIDYPGLLATREVLLGYGRRLAAEGLLGEPDDVWMLRRDELREAVEREPARPLGELVVERREELAAGLAGGPTEYLGEVPPAAGERHAVLEKFYGSGARRVGERILVGSGASPGTAEGRACVVRGPEDLEGIRSGDVLVATTTTPAWTSLFPSLAALVTETGGILSHAAIVAREYGIPAVVGAAGATRAIAPRARVRVDGKAGTVELL